PDNGLLWPAASVAGPPQVFELAAPEHRLPQVSATFHGRDVFAPAAAALASGVAPPALRPPVADPVRLELPRPRATPEGTEGQILWIDRFGNLITTLTPVDLDPGGESDRPASPVRPGFPGSAGVPPASEDAGETPALPGGRSDGATRNDLARP